MISTVSYVLDRLLFAVGLLLGAQLPLFLAACQQRLEGRLEQATRSLASWQTVADQLHGGSLAALVDKHRNSADLTFRREAAVLEELVADIEWLSEGATAMAGSLLSRLSWMTLHADLELARAALADFRPGFLFTPEALLTSLLVAFAASLAGRGGALLLRRIAARRTPLAEASSPRS